MTQISNRFEVAATAPPATRPSVASAAVSAERGRNLPVGYLRACVTLLVLAHHAVIAYIPGLPKPPALFGQPPFTWGAFPVEDAHATWAGFGLFTSFNDTFFMALMFFISGLFVWDSLKRKGAGGFLRDRAIRLGLPFAICATLLAPLAYFPSFLLSGAAPDLGAYARAMTATGSWPAGPAWFIWVLLAFGCAAAGLYAVAPRWGEALGRLAARADRRALRAFGKLLVASALAYTALALVFGPIQWLAFGPFTVQAARILHYAAYFIAGVAVGAAGLERGLLAASGALARRWWVWALAAPLAFVLSAALAITTYLMKAETSLGWQIATDVGFALACAAISFAFLAVFARFVRRPSPVWDSLAANAYGMYLVHYVFVTWTQYALLPASLPGLAKGALVVAAVVLLSWGTTATLRRVPAVRRVI